MRALSTRRYDELDFLRGCMLLMMTLDHLLWSAFRSIGHISDISYEFFGPVSSADGFVFLSGIVAGLVYGRMLLGGGQAQAEARILHRVRELYLINVLCIALLALGPLLVSGHRAGMASNLHFQYPGRTLLLGALHLSLPGFLDILPIYCYFLLILVPVLRLLRQGRMTLVLAASFACWLLGQAGPFQWIERTLNATFSPALPFNLGLFDLFAWQLPFVGGVVLGYLKATDKLPELIVRPSRRWFALAFGAAVVLFLSRHHLIPELYKLLDPFADVRTFGPLRIVGIVCIAYSLVVITARLPRLFSLRPLVFLGQHSLYVCAFHAMLCYGLSALLAPRLAEASTVLRVIALLTSLATLWVPAGLHQLWRNRRRPGGHPVIRPRQQRPVGAA